MSDTGWVSPNGVSSVGWTNPTNIISSDNTYASYSDTGEFNWSDDTVKLYYSGSSIGTGKWGVIENLSSTEVEYTYGGNNDLWGSSLTISDLENNYLFVDVSFMADSLVTTPKISPSFDFTSFEFPSGATLKGIEFVIECKAEQTDDAPTDTIYIDHCKIKVYYTESTPIIGTKYPLPAFKRS